LIDFENQFQFNSLRKVVEAQIVSWLNNTTLDTLNDPDDHFIMDEELRTLLTPDCKVMIGGNVENLCYASSQAAKRLGICFFKNCCHTGSSKEWFFY